METHMTKAHLLEVDHTNLQAKLRTERNRKATSRRHVHKGGRGARAKDLRAQGEVRDELERKELLRKAEKKLSTAINKAKKALKEAGIQARRDNKARLRAIQGVEFPPVDMLVPIRELDKDPTLFESLSIIPKGHPTLIIVVEHYKSGEYLYTECDGDDEDYDITIIVRASEKEVICYTSYLESSPPPLIRATYIESSLVPS
jgi:hypothetical protein